MMIEITEEETASLLQTTDNLAMLKAFYDAGMPIEQVRKFDYIEDLYSCPSQEILIEGFRYFCNVSKYERDGCDYDDDIIEYIYDEINDEDFAILFESECFSLMSEQQFRGINKVIEEHDATAYRCSKGIILGFDFIIYSFHTLVIALLDVLTTKPKERRNNEVYANVG